MARWTTPARWALPAALLVVLVAAPWAVGRWQARSAAGSDAVSAATVLTRVQDARDAGWSGNAESRGGLALPVTDVFSDLTDLAGSTTTMRAWWADNTSWRVDQLNPVGELDTVRDPGGSWQWDYQKGEATRIAIDPSTRVRLPQAVDLLPPTLGGRLASEALPSEVSRLPGREVAGHDTLGLRITPSQPQSTIAHVDLWADAGTGVPLRVEVAADGATVPAMSSTFLDVDLGAPDTAQLSFTPPPGADVRSQDDPRQSDIASAVDAYSDVRPPPQLAGLDLADRDDGLGAVGVYGRGVTTLVAVPLLERFSGGLRDQLAGAAVQDELGRLTLGVGPLNLLVTAPSTGGGGRGGGFWLLAGTVTPQTLATAADQLDDYRGDGS